MAVVPLNRDALIARLARPTHENLELRVYDDAMPAGHVLKPGDTIKGNLTIGIGRNLMGRGITKDEAVILCANDVLDVERALDAAWPWWRQLDETRQQILAELCFNMGAAKLAAFTHMLAALQAGDFGTAADEMLNSAWARQVGHRANLLIDAMRSGIFGE